ncbi:MAG: CARDB domain-containing protein [Thermoplasmatota archaeon]
MAGAAASESILFIGAVLAAASLAGAMLGVTGHYTAGLQARAAALGDDLVGRLAIVNDPARVPTSPLVLYVKNTGGRDLASATLAVLVDGVASDDWQVTVGGAAATTIRPGQLAAITVNDVTLAAGDHHATIIDDAGRSADLDFTV